MKVRDLIAKPRRAAPDAPVCVYKGYRPEAFLCIFIRQEKPKNPLNQARYSRKAGIKNQNNGKRQL